MSFTVLLLVLVSATSCGDCTKPPVTLATDWGWPSVAAPDGRSRFQLQAVRRTGPYVDGGGPTLQVQGQVESEEPDLLLSDLYGKLRIAADDGDELVLDRERSTVDAAHRHVVFYGIDVGSEAKRLRSLEFEVRLVRVKTWTTRTIEVTQTGEAQQVVLPPFEFSVAPEASGVTVGAYSTSETPAGPEGASNLFAHRWAAAAADVIDAGGSRLDPTAGGGSGGFTSQSYGNAFGAPPEDRVAYPISVTLRVPATWEDEIVRYRFADLDLSEVPPHR